MNESFFSDCVPYLTNKERMDIIEEFLLDEEKQHDHIEQNDVEKGN
jgi:hypothetical protein